MKRTAEQRDLENQKTKSIRKEINCNDKLSQLSDLANILPQFALFGFQSDTLVHNINSLKDVIPTVVTFGKQSSGKSTLYTLLFPEVCKDQLTGVGISTRCPISYKLGPDYENKVYVKDCFNNGNIKLVDNMIEAENYVNILANKHNCKIPDAEIICEVKCPEYFSIIDLPGFITDIGYQRYFDELKKKYLDKKHTIILHVAKADDDRETDISVNFIDGCLNTIIPVLTHADNWLNNGDKIDCINKHLNNNNVQHIAIVAKGNDKYNEKEMFEQLNLNIETKKNVIKTSSEFRNFIISQLRQKTNEMYPHIENCVKKVMHDINEELGNIGRHKPDMRDECINFKLNYGKKINAEFKSLLGPEINNLKKLIDPDIFIAKANDNLVPSFDILADELKTHNCRQVIGTEGWSELTKKYIKIMIESSKIDITYYINNYFAILKNHMINMMSDKYRMYSKVNLNILEYIESLTKKLHDDALEEITAELDNVAMDPYDANDSYVNDYARSLIQEPIRLVIKYFGTQTNKSDAVEKALKDPGFIINYVQKEMCDNDQYVIKGKTAKNQIVCLWKAKSFGIHTRIIETIFKYNRKYEKKLHNKIRNTQHEDLEEPELIDTKRQALIKFITQCENIIM